MPPANYYLILAIDARHLDYSNGKELLKTMVKHPSDGSKNSDVGHAWILLHGIVDGKCVVVEGGHSGELGRRQPKYFEGVMNYIDYGYSNPSEEQKRCPRGEPNPIKHLWEAQKDGFFQEGSGGHKPTFAAKINLTKAQFESICTFIDPRHYDYSNYAITGNQCSSFAAYVAQLAGVELDFEVAIPIPQILSVNRRRYILWEDPQYSLITLSSPDILEKSLMEAVARGRAEYILPWYLKHRYPKKGFRRKTFELYRAIRYFPSRYKRALQFI
jgi:hypothetical protein